MSFILDALKRSENERQRTIGPSLTDAPVRRQESNKPWWVIAVGALLAINLLVLVVVLARGKSEPAPAAVAQPAAPDSTAPQPSATRAAPAVAVRPANSPEVRSLADEAGASSEVPYGNSAPNADMGMDPEHADLAAAANVPDGPPIVRPIYPPAVTPLSSQASQASTADDMLPSANALAAGGTSLPDMRLDIHVYSTKPAERFVFINMHKYTEGQTLTEGPVLERITPDGAILNSRGIRFTLPRQ